MPNPAGQAAGLKYLERKLRRQDRSPEVSEASAAAQYAAIVKSNMAALTRSETTTYCPYKGEAAYFSIPAGGERSVDAIWTYEAPYDAVSAIKDHLAFYLDRIDAIEQSAA